MGTKCNCEAHIAADGAQCFDIIEFFARNASRRCPAGIQKSQSLQRRPTNGQPAFSLAVPIPVRPSSLRLRYSHPLPLGPNRNKQLGGKSRAALNGATDRHEIGRDASVGALSKGRPRADNRHPVRRAGAYREAPTQRSDGDHNERM